MLIGSGLLLIWLSDWHAYRYPVHFHLVKSTAGPTTKFSRHKVNKLTTSLISDASVPMKLLCNSPTQVVVQFGTV